MRSVLPAENDNVRLRLLTTRANSASSVRLQTESNGRSAEDRSRLNNCLVKHPCERLLRALHLPKKFPKIRPIMMEKEKRK